MNMLTALVRRDLLLVLRQGGGAGTALGFFLTVVVLLPLGLGPDLALLQRIAPGALWIALLQSVLLSAELPSLHSLPPVPTNTLSRCPPNRQQLMTPRERVDRFITWSGVAGFSPANCGVTEDAEAAHRSSSPLRQ